MTLPHSNYTEHDRDLCACGCELPVKDTGVVPRYATDACRVRWAQRMTLQPDAELESRPLDEGPQDPPPPPDPIPADEVTQALAECAQRITVAPQVEAALRPAPSATLVPPTRRSLWRLLLGRPRKVR